MRNASADSRKAFMTGFSRLWLASFAAALLLAAMAGSPLLAQQNQPSRPPNAPAAASKGSGQPAREAAAGGDAALRQRVEQLEEQLVDMQVVIGTLESLARGATAPASGSGAARQGPGAAAAISAADAGRLDGIETQIRALAAQLEQLQDQVRALGGRSGGLGAGPAQAANEPPPGPRPGRPLPESNAAQPERAGFGSVTVSPGAPKDEIDRILATNPPGAPPGQQAAAPAPPPEADMNPKQLYETAFGYLQQRDYGAAEAGFTEFMRRHPNDPLAGHAQFWLGETLYVRGQYRAAAAAFLKGYETYGRSAKAADSLLKFAMSMQRLGQKEAACTSFSELASKFPSASSYIKTTAQTERQRAGC